MSKDARAYRFGPYELRPRTRELFKEGVKLKLRPQPFQVLHILLQRGGDVVTREELRDLLWTAETFVDFEQGLNTSIKELRGALNDPASGPRYVETIPKLGYRILVPVYKDEPAVSQEAIRAPKAAEPGSVAGAGANAKAARRSFLIPKWAALLVILVAAITSVGFYLHSSRTRAPAQVTDGKMMLAVLPFENLTGDPGQEYFSDGLTEEMITQLGNVNPQRLGVIARSSVMRYKDTREQLGQIGQELGVQYVLEGSVRRDPHKVRIAAQLIQVKDQTRLWGREYDREASSLLTVQAEIAGEIADEIQLAFGGSPEPKGRAKRQTASPTTSYEAYDLYLKGRYSWNKRTPEGLRQAVEYFQQAVAKDPNYARAYAGLADSYVLMSSYSFASQNEVIPKARVAALRALQLDETLAEAHTPLALIAENYDWDWETAEKEYRRAIQLDPDYATAHHWYAEFLAFQGRFDEAFAEIEQARRLDPLSLIVAADNGAILYFSRQYDRAIDQLRSVLEMEPNFPRAHVLIYAYTQKGSYADALADIERWRRVEDTPWTDALDAYVYGRSGQPDQARRSLAKLTDKNRQQDSVPVQAFVAAYIGVRSNDKALALLQRAFAEHSNALTSLKVDPVYDPLRSDPRFQELLRSVRLTQ